MYTLKKNALVPHSARQMFHLVNDIEDYPRFLPWCHRAEIIEKNAKEITASLEVAWKGIHKTMTTRNVLREFDRIEINLVKGPLQHLEGIWHFYTLDESACKVTLDLEFEFTGHFVDRLFQPIFQHIANTLVEAFCKRAAELYGQP